MTSSTRSTRDWESVNVRRRLVKGGPAPQDRGHGSWKLRHGYLSNTALAVVLAVVLGVVVSWHLLRSEGLTGAEPQQIIELLRPCVRFVTGADGAPPAG